MKKKRRPLSLALRWKYADACRSSSLVIVLGCLAIISILIVAFFASIRTERQSSQFYANSSSVKLLADSTVSIVEGQIKDATRGIDNNGQTLAWASQPGMIRIYNTQGQAAGYYKLYSWTNMIGTTAFHAGDSTETPPSDWASYPALYTDLNDPVSGIYPIVNPAAVSTVKGFSITGAPVSARDAAPMPVQWLYVLEDGSLTTASAAGPGNTVTVLNANSTNPIVARVAFWTDDDTCKININTAAGDAWTNTSTANPPGAFWDTPRMEGTVERTFMAMNQPTHGEFQRYPGHPATTYLSAVFPNLTAGNVTAIVPRINGGGSVGGSVGVASSTPITQKTSRLYASVDEMLYSTTYTTNRLANTGITDPVLQTASFFLTAHSRAPEVNLYNQPRIITWPVSTNTTPSYRTAYDSLMAFDGTLISTNALTGALDTNAYFFQRTDSMSAINDLPVNATATGLGRNRALMQYLQSLTAQPVPGFSTAGETFLSKYGNASGASAPPTDRDQILTEIFDYIRSLNSEDCSSRTTMTNSFTPSVNTGANYNFWPAQGGQITPIYDSVTKTRGFGRFPTIVEADILFAGIGQTTGSETNNPIYATNYAGYTGTNYYQAPSYRGPNPPNPPTPYTETWAPPSQNWTSYTGSGGSYTNCAPGYTRVQPAFVGNLFMAAMGYAVIMQDYWIEIDGLNSFTWTDDQGHSYPMFTQATTSASIYGNYNHFGGYMGIYDFTDSYGYFPPSSTENVDALETYNHVVQGTIAYPDYGTTLDLPTGGTFQCSGGTVKIILRGPSHNGYSGFFPGTTPGPVLQVITVTFPPFTAPVPKLAPIVEDTSGSPPVLVTSDFRDIGQRFSNAGSTPKLAWITPQDVVRSMVLDSTKADPRMITAMTNVPTSVFIPGPNYGNSAAPLGHGIINGSGVLDLLAVPMPYLGAYYGSLVPNTSYSTNTALFGTSSGVTTNGLTYYTTRNLQPVAKGTYGGNGQTVSAAIPVAFSSTTTAIGSGAGVANGVFAGGGTSTTPGDWDTGVAGEPDGAYINKADEGDALSTATPYYSAANLTTYVITANFFSPNRMIPSAGMFGSLPTGVISQKPWQTLLFRPDPGAATPHIGSTSPADYLLLDLFNMPVVEPYPISDPFSTAGKINMNYQIVPFTYINRATGVEAVLRSEEMLAIPKADGPIYKTSQAVNRRYFIDLDQTLTGFSNRFATDDIFRSAAEICNIWLVPSGLGLGYNDMKGFWLGTGASDGALTGDNIRERPYANIYPRLTTKSNTYTVHYRVQMLKKVPTTQATQWIEGTDVITGEYRGSTTLERYLDTSNTAIPDYASIASQNPGQPLAAGQAIDNFYKFRVLETKQFNP